MKTLALMHPTESILIWDAIMLNVYKQPDKGKLGPVAEKTMKVADYIKNAAMNMGQTEFTLSDKSLPKVIAALENFLPLMRLFGYSSSERKTALDLLRQLSDGDYDDEYAS